MFKLKPSYHLEHTSSVLNLFVEAARMVMEIRYQRQIKR